MVNWDLQAPVSLSIHGFTWSLSGLLDNYKASSVKLIIPAKETILNMTIYCENVYIFMWVFDVQWTEQFSPFSKDGEGTNFQRQMKTKHR